MRKLNSTLIACIVALLPGHALAAAAKDEVPYPTKPVRVIVPFAPGGTNDILARMAATHLTSALGQTFIVDNRPGAEGIIGTDTAAKSRPDGYTLVVLSSAYTMNPVVMKLPYDSLKAFEFVSKMGASFLILSVGPSLAQVNSVNDLIAVAKAKPGQIVISSSGGFLHFASALFKSLSKADFNIVLYKGGFPAMMDVIGGQTHSTFAVSVPAIPHLKSGKLKGLAVGTLKRAELVPDIPTLDEVGIKGYDASNWYSIAAPAGTPRPIVMKLNQEIVRYFESPEVRKQMTNMGAVIDLQGPDEMRKIIPAEIAKWTKVAKEAGMPKQN